MIFQLLLHENPKVDTLIKRWVQIGLLVGLVSAGVVWFSGATDSLVTTEEEAVEFDAKSMEQHNIEIAAVPYAMKSDIDHIANITYEEQYCDAQVEIEEIEDKEAAGTATATETLRRTRLEKARDKAEAKIIEDGHDHDGCK